MATQFDSAKTAIGGTDHLPFWHAVTVLAATNFIGNKHTWDRAEFGRHLELSRCQVFYIACIFPGKSVHLDKHSLMQMVTPTLLSSTCLLHYLGKLGHHLFIYEEFSLREDIFLFSPSRSHPCMSLTKGRHQGQADLTSSDSGLYDISSVKMPQKLLGSCVQLQTTRVWGFWGRNKREGEEKQNQFQS